MNYLIQEAFNKYKDRSEKVLSKKIKQRIKGKDRILELYLSLGDKVIQTKNNYELECYKKTSKGNLVLLKEKGVMNGDIGVIVSVEVGCKTEEGEMNLIWVKYGGTYVLYKNNFKELEHAFAISIHKAQGSQWDHVLLMVSNSHYPMLENSIVYTGYTRGKIGVYTYCHRFALNKAIKTFRNTERNTSLTEAILTIVS